MYTVGSVSIYLQMHLFNLATNILIKCIDLIFEMYTVNCVLGM